jgi:hypothetical protein
MPLTGSDTQRPTAAIGRRAAALLLLLLVAATAGRPAQALDAFSAATFHRSIGVCLSAGPEDGVDEARYAAIKARMLEVGILNIRTKVIGPNVARIADLWSCCGIRTLALIDEHVDNLRPKPLAPEQIPAAVTRTLAAGTDAILAFEGPNEHTKFHNYSTDPDWPEKLRAYTAALYQHVRHERALPQPVIGPTVFRRERLDALAIGDIGAWVDASTLHFYPGGWEPSRAIDEHNTNMKIMAPGEPVWISEYGYHNASGDPGSNPVPELISAIYMTRLAAVAFQREPLARFFVYEFMNNGNNLADREHNLGLVSFDLTPKAQFHAYRRLIDAVEGGDPAVIPQPLDLSFSGDMTRVQTLLLQKSASRYVLLMWQEVPSWDRKLRQVISVAPRTIGIGLPRNADVSLSHVVPNVANPAQDRAPQDLGRGVRSATVDVPDRIVAIAIDLK